MPLTRKLGSIMRLSSSETACLCELQSYPLHIKRGTEIVHEGQAAQRAFILQSGWARCYKDLRDGGRQIISFPLPGDFMGLGSILLQSSNYSFAALTDVVVISFSLPA